MLHPTCRSGGMYPKMFLAGAAFAFSAVATPTFANTYAITELGVFQYGTGTAFGINNSGQVVGLSVDSSGVGYATIWNGTVPTYLGTLTGGTFAGARGINNSGEVVGYSENSNSQQNNNVYATIWNGTTPTMLGLPPGANWSVALGVNNHGQTVGYSNNNNGVSNNNNNYATSWNGTAPTILQTCRVGTTASLPGLIMQDELRVIVTTATGETGVRPSGMATTQLHSECCQAATQAQLKGSMTGEKWLVSASSAATTRLQFGMERHPLRSLFCQAR